MVDGLKGVKLGTQQYETEVVPDQMQRGVTAADTQSLYEQFIRARLRGVTAKRVHAIACPYTVALDSRFLVGAHPTVPAALVASACPGPGFKHSAARGEALAELSLQGHSRSDLSCFAPAAQKSEWQTPAATRPVLKWCACTLRCPQTQNQAR